MTSHDQVTSDEIAVLCLNTAIEERNIKIILGSKQTGKEIVLLFCKKTAMEEQLFTTTKCLCPGSD